MFDTRIITSIARRTLPLFSILIACSCALWAQPDGPGGPPPDGPPPGQSMQQRGPSVDHELKQLTQLLTLSSDQQTQVKVILTDQQQKIEALVKQSMPSADSAAPPNHEAMEAMHDSIKAIRDATNTKIVALLSDDQKAKFAAWEKKHTRSSQQGNDMPPPPDGGEGGPPPDGGGGPGGGGPPGV